MRKFIFVLIALILTGCGSTSDLETQSIQQELKDLTAQVSELNYKVDELQKSIILNTNDGNLYDLDSYESSVYESFKSNDYNKDILVRVDALTICKMYWHANVTEDFVTQYYLQNQVGLDGDVRTLEEYISDREIEKHNLNIDMYKNIYSLKVDYKTDDDGNEDAIVNWKVKVFDYDAQQEVGAGFTFLHQEENVWVVNYLSEQ